MSAVRLRSVSLLLLLGSALAVPLALSAPASYGAESAYTGPRVVVDNRVSGSVVSTLTANSGAYAAQAGDLVIFGVWTAYTSWAKTCSVAAGTMSLQTVDLSASGSYPAIVIYGTVTAPSASGAVGWSCTGLNSSSTWSELLVLRGSVFGVSVYQPSVNGLSLSTATDGASAYVFSRYSMNAPVGIACPSYVSGGTGSYNAYSCADSGAPGLKSFSFSNVGPVLGIAVEGQVASGVATVLSTVTATATLITSGPLATITTQTVSGGSSIDPSVLANLGCTRDGTANDAACGSAWAYDRDLALIVAAGLVVLMVTVGVVGAWGR